MLVALLLVAWFAARTLQKAKPEDVIGLLRMVQAAALVLVLTSAAMRLVPTAEVPSLLRLALDLLKN